jgi:hypothetical protein
MAPHQVPVRDDLPGGLGEGFDPATLEEERRPDAGRAKGVEDLFLDPAAVAPVGVLGVERQRDAKRAYRSTPVMTTPRTKKRWKMRNRTTGMIIVMSVPAWMRPGFSAIRAPLNDARPTGSVTRSGFVER